MIIRVSRFAFQIYKRNSGVGWYQKHIRHNCIQANRKVLEQLHNRSVLCVSGDETSSLLQGLITNDMKHLDEGTPSIYTLFLNIKGRVLYDAIVYRSEESNSYYVECDSQVAESLCKHLRLYRVKRKVNVEHMDNKINIWTMFDPTERFVSKTATNGKRKLEGMIFPCSTLNSKASKFVDNVMIHEDPRLPNLGFRILADSRIGKHEIIKNLNSDLPPLENTRYNYQTFRYKLGVGEGVYDLPPGKALPLEINCDYLHGVSFHKGCYIGQELTARIYHTGVVRKRLMPLIFDGLVDKSLTYDDKILDQSGNIVGKFRGYAEKYGLGLMRINESLGARELNISGIKVRVMKPAWWPEESQKETITVKDT